jgi:protein-tyrosine kinase
MKIANLRLEGIATKEVETLSDRSLPYARSIGEKSSVARQVDISKCEPSLVTMLPKGASLEPGQHLLAEQFRLLRTRVKALSKDFKLRTILITSALPGEGKTTVSANLAGSLSRIEGLRVLLIDFDLRHPSLHTLFGIEPDMHAPSALEGEVPWQDSVYEVNPRLDVLFGFRQLDEPDRLLQGSRLEKLLNEVKAEYDVVILDSAPMLAVADTHSLVPLIDCGIFVINADTTPISAAKEALAMLHDKVAGCVVNRVSRLKTEDYYRNSGYGYGYGYGSKRTEN